MYRTIFTLAITIVTFAAPFPVHTFRVFADDIQNIEVFDAWWDKKNNHCKVTFTSASSMGPATMQVDDGVPITSDQVLEVYREVKRSNFWTTYTYKFIYKDANSAVSEASIIFRNTHSSRRFQLALEKFGIY